MSNQDAYPPQSEGAPKQKSGCGCFAVGCLGVVALSIAGLVVMVGVGYWWVSGQVERYTSQTPADIPVVELPEEEMAELQRRIDSFKARVEGAGEQPPGAEPAEQAPAEQPPAEMPSELRLTAEQINALIAQDENLKGRVFVTIEEGEVGGQVSIPTDKIPGGKGRYLNASGSFDVSMENGVLIVRMTSAEVKGEPIPDPVMQELSKQNLAKDVYDDPDVARLLRKFESVQVEGDQLVLRLRDEAADDAPAETGEGDAPAETTETEEATETEGATETADETDTVEETAPGGETDAGEASPEANPDAETTSESAGATAP